MRILINNLAPARLSKAHDSVSVAAEARNGAKYVERPTLHYADELYRYVRRSGPLHDKILLQRSVLSDTCYFGRQLKRDIQRSYQSIFTYIQMKSRSKSDKQLHSCFVP